MDCLKMDVFAVEDNVDIEMMDFDDILDNDFSNKRKFNSVDETIDVSNISNKSPKSSPTLQLRPVLKARRRIPKMPSLETKDFCITVDEKLKPICVLDTNILLSNLIELKNVILIEEKLRQTTTKSKLKSIVIPWIVVQELDRMKTRKFDKSVLNVIHFINEQLKKSNGIIRGENELDIKSNKTIKKIEEEMNDDKIVNCCLKLKTICNSDNVILITNDMNLCNKALMTQLKAIDWKEFFEKYKSSDLYSVPIKPEYEDQIELKNKKFAKNRSKTTDKSVPNIRYSSNEKLLNRSSGQLLSTTSSLRKPCSASVGRQKSPIKRKATASLSKTVPPNIDLSIDLKTSSAPNECPLKYDDWIRFKDECEQKLLKYIEDTYREIWENDWQKMLELDINNTNLKEIIRVMRKEWNSNFSDHFNRDKTIRALVDSLHTSLVKSSANYQLYYKDLKHFVDLIQQKQSSLQMKGLKSRKTI